MHAMILDTPGQRLRLVDQPRPSPTSEQLLIKVHACGICRTDLHILDGDIPSFPDEFLWGERVLRSVANLTRQDGEEFLALAPQVPVQTHVHTFPLAQANQAIAALR